MTSQDYAYDPRRVVDALNEFQVKLGAIDVPTITFTELSTLLSKSSQREVLNLVENLKPLNKSLPRSFKETDTSHLIKSRYAAKGHGRFVRLSPEVSNKFELLNLDFADAVGYRLDIISGYRSPAYQALLVCRKLFESGFQLDQTLREILPPGYSDHQAPVNHAIDIALNDAELNDAEFMKIAYPWLAKNAGRYGFIESYPREQSDMIWEPWHWRLS